MYLSRCVQKFAAVTSNVMTRTPTGVVCRALGPHKGGGGGGGGYQELGKWKLGGKIMWKVEIRG